MSAPVDALVYASIKNNLTLTELSNLKLSTRFTVPSGSTLPKFMDDVLDKTTIKKACCLKSGRDGNTDDKFPVRVKIPVPKNYNFDEASEPDIWKKFGYIEKTVNVPKNLCSVPTLNKTYGFNEDVCQDFMVLYCENVKKFYKDEVSALGKKPDTVEFSKYSPECACLADRPEYLQKGGALPPICYADGCDPSNKNVFIDLASRKPCTVTICQTNLDLDSLKAGGNVNVNSKVSQQCGNQINQPATPATSDASATSATPATSDASASSAASATSDAPVASDASATSDSPAASAPATSATSAPSTDKDKQVQKADESGDKIMGIEKKTFYGVAGGGICLCIILIIIVIVVLRKKK